jgi:dihydroorotate dehydrogenase (fumarate)
MNLATNYLGLNLSNPIMPGASPMVDNLDTVKQLEDSGAAAIVMHSLFEEQAPANHAGARSNSRNGRDAGLPAEDDYQLEPDQYFEQVRTLKETVQVPVIASINGSHIGGWIDFARAIEQAGADALELNFYYVATDPTESSHDIESQSLEVLRAVRESVRLPIAVKISPYYSSLCYFANELDALGANGLVLFNRFYQPDLNPDTLEHSSHLELSDPAELRLRLRWLGILRGNIKGSLACTGGIHRGIDVVKAIMAGANAVQCVSSLLHFGPKHVKTLLEALRLWMETHEYGSVAQMVGRMSLHHCPDAAGYERANYVRVLNMWKA